MLNARNTLPETLVTTRLTLRKPVSSDLADLVALANNPNVVAPTATMPFPYLEEHAEAFVAGVDDPTTPRAYAIANADDRLMGVVSLKFAPDTAPELGYWLGEPHWGHGYTAEAAKGLLDAVRHNGSIPKVRARVLQSNPASARVLDKLGFVVIERTLSSIQRHLGQPLLLLEWRAA
ncbi:hypothetical protein WH87_17835 [Devosia epidermidihirudinis]|uniref:N-acetyltransferase domain-containing protein n=1 Tax=Devosia epidermidihirudinis TaxID=1293439 RepID=A0A0F5Q2D8_9HYPH|nr:GNAT family N-acetyltransferase [Devosia epidermidihirudinis]KKC35030.1 hypothetical protein WH87_17835 [Devosia epidermidihirudinis]